MIIEIDRLNLNQRWLIASIRKLKRFFFFAPSTMTRVPFNTTLA
ncbi:hypothetical protein ACFQUX_09480 [Pantoea stewartii]